MIQNLLTGPQWEMRVLMCSWVAAAVHQLWNDARDENEIEHGNKGDDCVSPRCWRECGAESGLVDYVLPQHLPCQW